MNNQEYNNYISKIEFSTTDVPENDIQIRIKQQYMEKEVTKFLEQLSKNFVTIEEKAQNYPESYWNTSEGKKTIREGMSQLFETQLVESNEEITAFFRMKDTGEKEESLKKIYNYTEKSLTPLLKKIRAISEKIETTETERAYFVDSQLRYALIPFVMVQKDENKEIDTKFVESIIKDVYSDKSNFVDKLITSFNLYITDDSKVPEVPLKSVAQQDLMQDVDFYPRKHWGDPYEKIKLSNKLRKLVENDLTNTYEILEKLFSQANSVSNKNTLKNEVLTEQSAKKINEELSDNLPKLLGKIQYIAEKVEKKEKNQLELIKRDVISKLSYILKISQQSEYKIDMSIVENSIKNTYATKKEFSDELLKSISQYKNQEDIKKEDTPKMKM